MPKKSIAWSQRKTSELFEAILALKTKDECRRFFRDLCTLEEITDIADRWQIVKMIVKEKPQREIAKQLGVSVTTVTRVAHWLSYGLGGYRLIIKRLKLN